MRHHVYNDKSYSLAPISPHDLALLYLSNYQLHMHASLAVTLSIERFDKIVCHAVTSVSGER